jgi:hypothetical protein
MNTIKKLKKEELEKRKRALEEEYKAANAELTRTIGASSLIRVQRQIDDIESELTKIEKELRELEKELRKLEEDPEPPPPPPPNERTEIQLLLSGHINDFTAEQRIALIIVIASILQVDKSDIRILRVESGSIRVTVEVPRESLHHLTNLHKDQKSRLMHLHVKTIQSNKLGTIRISNGIVPWDKILLWTAVLATSAAIMLFLIPHLSPSDPLTPTPAEIVGQETPTATAGSEFIGCGVSHPEITGSNSIAGSVTIDNPTYTTDCLVLTQDRLFLEISWESVSPGAELWLLVYSPFAKLYYPHYCVLIQQANGGQNCQAILGQPEPYEIIVIFADATAHDDLLNISRHGSGATHGDLPAGIREMGYISVVRVMPDKPEE